MIRELITTLIGKFAERSHLTRRKMEVPIKIWFDPARNMVRTASVDSSFMTGETSDLSGSGIGFVVSAIRIKENYLVGCDRLLNVELDLPGGKIRMKVIGRRYEKVGMHVSTEKYQIGAEIVEISAADREAYEYFLRNNRKLTKVGAAGLALGVDKS